LRSRPRVTPNPIHDFGMSLRPLLVAAIGIFALATTTSGDDSASEEVDAASGRFESTERATVATLPPAGDHWIWVPDRLLGHSLLYDGDSGIVLGMIDSPSLLTPQVPLVSTERGEIYSVDVSYSRGNRGTRIDFLTIYDLETLDVKDEIIFPTRAATGNTAIGYSARIGSRFIGVFNQFPATSISILDLETRSFVEEIGVSGCSGIYPIDALRFATLCGDGTATVVELTDEGRKSALIPSDKFFDTIEDPVFTSAGRIGTQWIFVSFLGMVHTLDFSRPTPAIAPEWSLHGEKSGASQWRPGGLQVVAVHAPSERLFVVMHEGGDGSHKDAGPEVWSFDLVQKKRLSRIVPPALSATFLGGVLGIPADSFSFSVLSWVLPADTVHSIAISQDPTPVLFMRNAEIGAVGVVAPDNGAAVRVLGEAGLYGPTLGTR
jgi:methylamine dehydrogenase heavy chain